MFEIQIEQYQWLWVGVLTGVALVLAGALAYHAIWEPRAPAVDRQQARREGPAPGAKRPQPVLPWVLIVTYVFVIVYSIVYLARAAIHPPNW
jgi:hypothetical protein